MHRKPPLTHPCDPSGRSFTSERELAEFKKRQQLRESSIEIRQLEAKLRQAYINQELALQRKQKEVLEFEKKQEKLIEAQLLEQRRLESLKEEKETDQKLVIEQIKYKMALDDQMVERQDQINQNYQEFLKEKTKIDEIIAKVKEEQRNKTIENMVKKQVAQDEIQEFIESQKIFVIKDQERVLRENEAIKAFIAKKEAWTEEQNKIQAVLKVKKHEFVQSLGEKLEAERINEREKELLLHELNEGRQRERDRIQEQLELEQEIRKRLNFKQANEIALEYREKIRAKLKNEDEEWKRKIMDEAEKAAKLDQMGNQKRRMKMLELRRDADRLLAERQKIREIEKKEEKLFWLEQQEAERQKQMIIEEERQKLLREHAHKLIGFLPTEILNEEDLERLGREDVRFLYKPDKAVSPMTALEQKFAPNTNY